MLQVLTYPKIKPIALIFGIHQLFRMRKLLLFSLGLCLILTGCDAHVLYKLYVHNETGQQIQVAYTVHGKDSSLTIPVGEKAMLMEEWQINSGVKPYFNASDEVYWLKSLAVQSGSGTPHKGDLRLADRWEFERAGPVGLYHLYLKEADFGE